MCVRVEGAEEGVREREKRRKGEGRERETERAPASQPGKQRNKHCKNEQSVFRNDSTLQRISFSQKDFKPIAATRVKLKVNNTTRKTKRECFKVRAEG